MDSFYSFVCQRVAKNPSLIGETSSSIQLDSPIRTLDTNSKKILSGDSTAAALSEEIINSVVMRSLIAPLSPYGLAHLLHTLIWPYFLAAETAAKKVHAARKKREVGLSLEIAEGNPFSPTAFASFHDEIGAKEEETIMKDYLTCVKMLDAAIDEARRKVKTVEEYLKPFPDVSKTSFLLS